ncbi:MAG: polymer-forming cytoskeletal protein [Flavobacteriia bacterium]|nr:polymer-forming cytoskeletal protein [Flavobacteriia bacterium]
MAMFGKKERNLDSQQIATIIADGCQIDGQIQSNSSIKIDGIVKGDVTIQSGIIIGLSGKVTGDVKAKEAVIYGTLNGNIYVEKLEIRSSGKINGDIQTTQMEMEFGAVYNGRVNMTPTNTSTPLKTIKKEQENGFIDNKQTAHI